MLHGERVLLERRRLGLNQDVLAEKVGVNRSYISQIENNLDINIGLRTMFALAEALGVAPEYLMGLTDNPLHNIEDEEEEPTAINEASVPYGNELLQLYESLPEDDKEFLLQMARKLTRADTPRIIGEE